MRENGFTHKKRVEANDIKQKLLLMKTTLMILSFLQLNPLKPNFCFITWRGACGVMVIVVGNGHGETSSNPGRD